MRPRTVVYIVVLLIIGVLVLANWSTITQPTQLNLLVARVTAPIGLMVLLIAGAILALDWIVYGLSRRSWSLERRDLGQQIERLRVRADQAEESRIRALRETVEREFNMVHDHLERLIERLTLQQSSPPVQRERTLPAAEDTRY